MATETRKMGLLDVVLAVEDEQGDWTDEEVLQGISEWRPQLCRLQGMWGRLIARLEEEGVLQ